MVNTTLTNNISIKQDAEFGQGFVNQNGDELTNFSYTETASTAANLKHFGFTDLDSTAAKSFNIDAPVPGCIKTITMTAGTTTINTVVVGSTVNGISVGGASTTRKLQFNAINDSVTLKATTTTKWIVTSNTGSVVIASS